MGDGSVGDVEALDGDIDGVAGGVMGVRGDGGEGEAAGVEDVLVEGVICNRRGCEIGPGNGGAGGAGGGGGKEMSAEEAAAGLGAGEAGVEDL